MDKNSILKLRPSVAVVTSVRRCEFFLSDIRKSLNLELDEQVARMLLNFDGSITILEWMKMNNIDTVHLAEILKLLKFLNEHHIVIDVDEPYLQDFNTFPRIFSLLENFSSTQSEVNKAFNRLKKSVVLIVGLGSVGTWVTKCLSMSGVNNFILVDNDCVDISNLHRQVGFTENSVGKRKTEAFKEYLHSAIDGLNITCINDQLDSTFFNRHNFGRVDLLINCADYPSVDETSRIIAEYSMFQGIAHCIGGGYNLHQSLIGQIIIPGKTACLECFRHHLDELNVIDTSNIKKLKIRNRKVGSFPPISALSASITANEAFKYLAGIDHYVMTNKRVEFITQNLNFNSLTMDRFPDCKWCGKNGIFKFND